jgi:hypothetical protein
VTRVQINPNLRIRDGMTVANLDFDVFDGTVRPRDRVEVFCENLVGEGLVMDVDVENREVVVNVNWSSLRLEN